MSNTALSSHLRSPSLSLCATPAIRLQNPYSAARRHRPARSRGARLSKSTMPQPLPDELLEEVLRRLPPQEPAELVRAALVSTRWCRLVTDPVFRRRFCEFHRSPPMLGFLSNLWHSNTRVARFVPTTAFCYPRTDFRGMHVRDARHGRVLFEKGGNVLVVWNSITDEVREFPFPQENEPPWWTAAIVCSAADACDHLDCHQGRFLVVYVCFNYRYGFNVIYTYSSDAASWSEPVMLKQLRRYVVDPSLGSELLVGKALYFGNLLGSTALKYDLELCQASLIQLPSPGLSMLTTMEDGGLGLVTKDYSRLYLWSRKNTHDAKWEKRVIELRSIFPNDVVVTELRVIGSGAGIIFMRTGDHVYTIDLKTYKVKKICEHKGCNILPYMSFYTPVLKGTCTSEGPSADQSSK